jgi:lipopolysaccharide/colanic/teichoic acid biosynthesis glycosyltransferase
VKRLFDVVVTMLLLLPAAPIMLIVAICIRFDSPGPILYGSLRIGKNGHRFGLLRFRTVDVDKPSHLSMNERMTHVGRFIRNYSLDDLPNLLNVLKGDLSIVGPRPTEPECVDMSDPLWQRVLSVRPGMISAAIIQLGREYNASSHSLTLQLEAEYVAQQSMGYDLRLCGQAWQGLIVSRGNWKARGKPSRPVSPTE